ncbi:MAG: FmdB family zinc ribbon protein [Planctomycetota bacterium]
MPTYDYECSACEHRVEPCQKITDDPLAVCPKCKRKKLIRLFGTGAAVVFKGSGFYQTDYRSESYKRAASSDHAGSGGKAEGGSASGSEASSGNSGAAESPAKPKSGGKAKGGGKTGRGGGKGE